MIWGRLLPIILCLTQVCPLLPDSSVLFYTYGPFVATWSIKLGLFLTACAICGVLCISLPIPIIVNNFNKFYEKAKIEEEIEAKRKKTSWEDAKRGKFQNSILINFHHLFQDLKKRLIIVEK